MGRACGSKRRRQVVKTLVGLGAADGSPKLGKASAEMGRQLDPVCEDQGRNLGKDCQRPDEVVLVGGRVCCKALVTGFGERRRWNAGETRDGAEGKV